MNKLGYEKLNLVYEKIFKYLNFYLMEKNKIINKENLKNAINNYRNCLKQKNKIPLKIKNNNQSNSISDNSISTMYYFFIFFK